MLQKIYHLNILAAITKQGTMAMPFAAVPELVKESDDNSTAYNHKNTIECKFQDGKFEDGFENVEISVVSDGYSDRWNGVEAIHDGSSKLLDLFADASATFAPYKDKELPIVSNIQEVPAIDIDKYIINSHETVSGRIKAVMKIKTTTTTKDSISSNKNRILKWLKHHTVGCFSRDVQYK